MGTRGKVTNQPDKWEDGGAGIAGRGTGPGVTVGQVSREQRAGASVAEPRPGRRACGVCFVPPGAPSAQLPSFPLGLPGLQAWLAASGQLWGRPRPRDPPWSRAAGQEGAGAGG